MGQQTFGIMYGVKADPPSESENGWDDLVDKFNGMRPDPEYPDGGDGFFLGYWVAVGGSGKDDCAYLADPPFEMSRFYETEPYADFFRQAVDRWGVFETWAKKQGQTFPEPMLWLMTTETA